MYSIVSNTSARAASQVRNTSFTFIRDQGESNPSLSRDRAASLPMDHDPLTEGQRLELWAGMSRYGFRDRSLDQPDTFHPLLPPQGGWERKHRPFQQRARNLEDSNLRALLGLPV